MNTRGVEDAVYLYAWALDEGDVEALVELFTENAELVVGENIMRGRDAILAHFERSQANKAAKGKQGRHMITNVVITADADDRASATAYMTAFATSAEGVSVVAVGRYYDTLVNED